MHKILAAFLALFLMQAVCPAKDPPQRAGDNYRAACIVSDVRLPAMSGLDLQRKLKDIGCTSPVILITGHGDIPMAVTAIRNGAFDFIEKPYDAERLLAIIECAW